MIGLRSLVGLGIVVLLLLANLYESNAKLMAKPKSASSSSLESIVLRKTQNILQLLGTNDYSGSLALSLKDYRELVFESPRNHTTFVLFYNDPQTCETCAWILEAFDKIANSFLQFHTKFDKASSTWDMQIPAFFVRVKMSEGIRHMLVDLDPTKPSLFYFAPSLSSRYNQFEKMDQNALSTDVGQHYIILRMMKWIDYVADIKIAMGKEKPASNSFSNLMTVGMIGLMIAFNVYYFGHWDSLMQFLNQANYGYMITILVIWLVSGQMFNYIRYTPMFGNGFGIGSVIYPGMRSQYGSETIIVMILYAVIMYAIISLVETRERQLKENLTIEKVQNNLLGALSGFFFAFMTLQIISQIKTGGS